jgi:predicted amidohydrolase YtcJ
VARPEATRPDSQRRPRDAGIARLDARDPHAWIRYVSARNPIAHLNGDHMNAIVLTNANVITCDARGGTARALAIDAGRVVAVGDEDSVLSRAGTGARTVDLDGATVLPGLIDTHPHLMHFGVLSQPLVDLADAASHTDIADRIARRARDTPPGEWIMATPVGEAHYFIRRSYRDLAEGDLPDRVMLDRAAPDHPVFIQAWAPVTPNMCAMNSLALRQLGIDRTLPDVVDDVWIEKDAAGEPTGRLSGSVTNYYTDSRFMNRLLHRMPLLQPDAVVPGTERAMRAANAMGVTTVYEGHLMVFELIEMYRWLRAENRLTLRVLCSPEAEPFGIPWAGEPLNMPQYLQRLARARDLVDRGDDLFRVDGVTVSRYGPCGPGFTLMRQPYTGPYGQPTTGRSFISPEKIEQAIAYCRQTGLRLSIVTAGLAETDTHLDQLEALGQTPLAADGRAWLLQNLYFAEPDQIRRMAALGMEITTTMSFSWGKGELVRERLGEHLLPDFIPLARLLDAGLHVGCGSDWGPKNVFEHIALAVDPYYAASGRKAATPGVTRRQALDMWTREAAHVLRWEGIGSLEPGHHADLVVVDRDPLHCPTEDLPHTQVIATMLAGQTVAGAELVGNADEDQDPRP